MSYRVEVHYTNGDTAWTHYTFYPQARDHCAYRLDDKYVSAVRVTNEKTGKVRFKRAKDAAGLRWLHQEGADVLG
ncbi:hypothetical protein EVC11_019 [Rhizobium phage RHph_I20]|uniref:Uncharacterized protein n=1 Tax=Rhizobium phage RHph_I20 TaxID=2509730 RepID=A0A7S5UZL7_9CAUD|nr:hypothetical protein EVC11_019 [Rhizobium phage RHph_I20]